jgi:hypothetical protein
MCEAPPFAAGEQKKRRRVRYAHGQEQHRKSAGDRRGWSRLRYKSVGQVVKMPDLFVVSGRTKMPMRWSRQCHRLSVTEMSIRAPCSTGS